MRHCLRNVILETKKLILHWDTFIKEFACKIAEYSLAQNYLAGLSFFFFSALCGGSADAFLFFSSPLSLIGVFFSSCLVFSFFHLQPRPPSPYQHLPQHSRLHHRHLQSPYNSHVRTS